MRRLTQVVLVLALGCASEGSELRVDLRTDLVPAIDYIGTVVRVAAVEDMRFAFGQDVVGGYRVGEFTLPHGRHTVEVELLGEGGSILATRRVSVDVSSDIGVTVVVSRECVGVECSEGLTCNGGLCVDPACSVDNLAACEPACSSAEECASEESMCGPRVCVLGQCLADVESSCSASEWCHPDEGCVARDTGGDPGLTLIVDGSGAVVMPDRTCGPNETCELRVPRGTDVVLEQREETDPFWGWIGTGCGRDLSCTVRINGPETVRALFAPSRASVSTVMTLDESGEPASLRYEDFLVLDDGLILVADSEDDRIWEIRDGVVRAFAGSGVAGYLDGPALAAGFTNPTGLTRDDAGNIYIADKGNNRIRRITLDGMVETYAGNGTGTASEGARLSAGIPTPSKVLWRTNDDVLLVTGSASRLVIVDDTNIRRLEEVDIDSRADPAVDETGTLYWGGDCGVWKLALGATEPELHAQAPCGREDGYDFAVAARGGVVVDSRSSGYGLCRIGPDGVHRIVVLSGNHTNGVDYEARINMLATALHFAPDGRLFTVDDWPGRRLRVITPN